MKIVSYNILWGGYDDYRSTSLKPERIELIIEAIKSLKADFVSLVDVYKWKKVFSNEELSEIFGYKYVYQESIKDNERGEVSDDFGIAVMTNLEVKKFETCWIETRNCVKTSLNIDGEEMEIFSVYLDNWTEEKRKRQVKALLGLVNTKLPTIICGDLNAIKKGELSVGAKIIVEMGGLIPKWRAERDMVRDMAKGEVIKMFEDKGLMNADLSGHKTIPSKMGVKGIFGAFLRLDYFFFNQKLKLKNFRVIKSPIFDKTSDHYPIEAEFE